MFTAAVGAVRWVAVGHRCSFFSCGVPTFRSRLGQRTAVDADKGYEVLAESRSYLSVSEEGLFLEYSSGAMLRSTGRRGGLGKVTGPSLGETKIS